MWWMIMTSAGATPPLTAEMHEDFALLTETREHVVGGRLDDAKATAALLARVELPDGLPRDWRRPLRELRRDARRTSRSDHLVDAASGVGQLAQSCGACHASTGGGPALDQGSDIPDQEWVEGGNMALHQWATTWMWLGLVADDDVAWQRGAQSLTDRPIALLFEEAPAGGSRPQLEQLVYGIANLAREADRAERGALMGKLLATCAECHVGR